MDHQFPLVSKLLLSELCGIIGIIADRQEVCNWYGGGFVIIYLVKYPGICFMEDRKLSVN